MIHVIKYLKTEPSAKDTAIFYFEKPPGFTYRAGQFGDFTLINAPETDAEGNSRSFTFSSAPDEEYLAITTRLRDTAFKRVLRGLKPESDLIVDAPLGVFTLRKDSSRPLVFLAGGIGVTPFRSLIVEASEKKMPHKIFLFYSNRTPADAPFLDELTALEEHNKNYKLIPTMTRPKNASKKWTGETGYISVALLKKYLPDLKSPIYYIAGPAEMVQSLHQLLNEAGISDDDIKIEEFIGY
ncbi:MAG: FAD-dependent oxidoreductase [Patescibacteria group bacterium]